MEGEWLEGMVKVVGRNSLGRSGGLKEGQICVKKRSGQVVCQGSCGVTWPKREGLQGDGGAV